MTLEQYRARLEAQGVPWSIFTSDARTELMLSKLREREVDGKITVSDAEVANYIASQRGPSASQQQDLRFQHIFIKAPTNAPQADIEAAQKKADALLQQAKSGADFEKLAKNNSEANDAKKGGDLGFKAPSALPADVVDAASKLRPVGQPDADPRAGRLRDRAPRRSSPEVGRVRRGTEDRADARTPHPVARGRRQVGR